MTYVRDAPLDGPRGGLDSSRSPDGSSDPHRRQDGRYSVTWRDTTTNDVVLETDANADNGRLRVDTPAITRSAAARIVRTAH